MKDSTKKVALLLRQQRELHSLSVPAVVDRLKSEFNIEINEKTLYGYESGVSMPKVTTFIALCTIYNVGNLSDGIGYSTPVSVTRNEESWTADQYNDFFNSSLLEKVYLLLSWGIPDFEGYQDKLSEMLPNDSNSAQFERLYALFRRLPSDSYESAFFMLDQLADGKFPGISLEERNLLSAYRLASPEDRSIIDNIIQRYVPQSQATKNEKAM